MTTNPDMPPDALLLGFDVGGTKSSVVVGTAGGKILARDEWPSGVERGPDAMIIDMLTRAERMRIGFSAIRAAGVSIGGPLDSRRGVIHHPPHLPGWDAIPLKARLEAALVLPVQVVHDAAACAYAEYLWGAGQSGQNLVYLTCGTGFGSGFIFDGKIHRGANGASCEVGHIALRREGPVCYGKAGSAEAFCSGTGLSLLAAWRFPGRWGAQPPSGVELARLAAAQDAQALEIIQMSAVAVGEVAAILADTLGLDLILLGSLARYLGEPWLIDVRRAFNAQVLPSIASSCRIEAASLADRLQDCSALAAALSS